MKFFASAEPALQVKTKVRQLVSLTYETTDGQPVPENTIPKVPFVSISVVQHGIGVFDVFLNTEEVAGYFEGRLVDEIGDTFRNSLPAQFVLRSFTPQGPPVTKRKDFDLRQY